MAEHIDRERMSERVGSAAGCVDPGSLEATSYPRRRLVLHRSMWRAIGEEERALARRWPIMTEIFQDGLAYSAGKGHSPSPPRLG
jgi:hypothetical protein